MRKMVSKKLLICCLLTVLSFSLLATPAMADYKGSRVDYAFLVMYMSTGGGAGFIIQGYGDYAMYYTPTITNGYYTYIVTKQIVDANIKNYKAYPFTQNIIQGNVKYSRNDSYITTYFLPAASSPPYIGDPNNKYFYFSESVNRYFYSYNRNKFTPAFLWNTTSNSVTPKSKGVEWTSVTLP